MKKLNVLLVDDQVLVRETLANLLSYDDRFELVEDTGDGSLAIEMIQEKKPDLLILDINMTPIDGFEILKTARKNSPGTKVIAVSLHAQLTYVKKMIKNGAKGYVTKNSSSDEFIRAIDEVLAGNTYICQEIKDILFQQTIDDETGGHRVSQLTEREIEIIQYLKEGLSSKEIGIKLFITAKTVEVHRHNILKKLSLKNSVALVDYANKHGL